MAILQNKFLMLLIGGIALAGVVWYSFLRDDNTQLLQTQDLTSASNVEGDVVNTLLELRSVSLSGTIFSDPSFQALRDFSTPITPEPVGRPNPFAPLQLRLGAPNSPDIVIPAAPTTTATTSTTTSS